MIRKLMAALALVMFSAATGFATNISVSGLVVTNYAFNEAQATLRIYYSDTFVDSLGNTVVGDAVGGPNFFNTVTCTVNASTKTATCPTFTLPSTTDSSKPTVKVTLSLYDAANRVKRKDLYSWSVPTSLGSPVTVSQLVTYNQSAPRPLGDTYYTATQTNALIQSSLTVGSPATTTTLGRVKMSTAPTDPASPIAVSDTDPRVGHAYALDPTKAPYSCLSNGTAQATTCLQNALNAAAASNGVYTKVKMPSGNYRFNSGTITVPDSITLEGTRENQSHTGLIDIGIGISLSRFGQPLPTDGKGTTILIDTGAGTSTGAFITAKINSTVRGISFYYPSQPQQAVTPTAYPWTITTDGNAAASALWFNITLENLEFINSYQCIYAHGGGRILIRDIIGQPIAGGIFVDKVYDSSRVENVQWTFTWSSPATGGAYANIYNWSLANGYGMKLGRVDNIYITKYFALGFKHGIAFVDTPSETYGGVTLVGGGPWATISDSGVGDAGSIGMYFSATGGRTIGDVSVIRIKLSNIDFAMGDFGMYIDTSFNGDIQVTNSQFAAASPITRCIRNVGSPVLTITGNNFNDCGAAISSNFDPALSSNPTVPLFTITGNTFTPNTVNAYEFAGQTAGNSSGNIHGGSWVTTLNNISSFAFFCNGERVNGEASSMTGLCGSTRGLIMVNHLGNVFIGPKEGSPLATNESSGHMYIPSTSGAPTGAPAVSTSHVPLVYDRTNKKLCIYDGAWRCGAAFTP